MGITASFPALAASTAILDLPFQLSTSARRQVNAEGFIPRPKAEGSRSLGTLHRTKVLFPYTQPLGKSFSGDRVTTND